MTGTVQGLLLEMCYPQRRLVSGKIVVVCALGRRDLIKVKIFILWISAPRWSPSFFHLLQRLCPHVFGFIAIVLFFDNHFLLLFRVFGFIYIWFCLLPRADDLLVKQFY